MPKKQKELKNNDIYLEVDNESLSAEIQTKIKKLNKEISRLKKQNKEYLDGWKRAMADNINEVKRVENMMQSRTEQQITNLLSEILPALDSFDMALKTPGDDIENLKKGLEYISKQLSTSLNRAEITTIGLVGEPFDSDIHHSVANIETKSQKTDGTILEVVRYGYKYQNVLIRPADVKVGTCKGGEKSI